MKRFTSKRGLGFRDPNNKLWLIERRLPSGKIQLIAEDGEILNLQYAELLSRWQSQEWQIDEASLAELGNAIYVVTPRDLSTYPPEQQAIAKRRFHYLKIVDPEKTPYNANVWSELIVQASKLIGDAKPPCASSVAVWWGRFRATKSILKLIPYSKPSSAHQHKPGFLIFEQVIAAVYLTDQKLPKLAVVEAMQRQVKAINNGLPENSQIKCPGRTTIYRWLEALEQDLVDLKREGAEFARMKYRAAIGTVETNAILQRFEIDHTPIDVLVVDLVLGIANGRPYLTMAIDRYSRLIVGFYVSFRDPSANSVLQCLKRAILPKDVVLKRFPDIKQPWPAFGIPELIAVDNGPDLQSIAVEVAGKELGINTLFCPIKSGDKKGSIERFLRTQNSGLLHRMPGTVFSNPDERGDYQSEKEAAIDFNALVHILTKWIVDVYNVTPHRGLNGRRPLDVWIESAQKRLIELPLNPQQLDVIVGIAAKRTLFHYGIELDGLQYNSLQLQEIRRRTGKNIKLDLKFHEDDVGYIHVLDPDRKEYLRVPAKLAGYANGLNREQHRQIREHTRSKLGENCTADQLLDAKKEVEDLIRESIQHKKMVRRKKAAQTVQHDSEAVLAGKNPLEEARKPHKPRPARPPEDMPAGLDDDLPVFTSTKKGGI
ncbi:transposase [Iodobacter sp. HSC-16F04]|uniref:Transposase n=1 Tax=Iodobacter violaceini TaxID=3044271 RepID=A0ABX0KRN2_9NEIS|nr:Mu transposase C-terminal domain-containing protein [Iodobacter violacea]NHQ87305.1 transposase [Iodobacter violacea]